MPTLEVIGMKQNKPVIGILPTFNWKEEEIDPYKNQVLFVKMYSDNIKQMGGLPIGLLLENIDDYFEICDGFLWPGGNKINKEFYTIFEKIIQSKKPLLGICLGAQAIATYFNILEDKRNKEDLSFEETYQQMKETKPYLQTLKEGNIHNHFVTKEKQSIESAKHQIKIKKDTLLYSIYKTDILNVVSLHNIAIARTSMDMPVSAVAEDKVIEAVEYTKNGAQILGVQWHPEIINDDVLFSWLISAAQNIRK